MLVPLLAALSLAAACGGAQPGAAPAASPIAAPRAITLRPELLARARDLARAGDPRVKPAYDRLLADAAQALRAPLVAVTQKSTLLPPTGDRHDYYSLSPYWWPDPSKPDGLPYIRRDGVTNPESKRDLDQPRVARLGMTVQTLALAYALSGDERFAARAAEQLRTWFLDSATRMTPHLRFAQLVRGNPRERGSGIIDTRWFIEVTDAASLVEGSRSWTPADAAALRAWMRQYLRWLRESPNGAHERQARNNHGSWYAAQVAAIALYVGDTTAARETIGAIPARIGAQITVAGEQPIENERTRSMHYAGFNIEALSRLAEMGRTLGIDLWRHEAPEGGSLRRAVDHVAKYVADPAKWPGRQIDPIETELFVIHLRRAMAALPDTDYTAVLAALPQDLVRRDRSILLYPPAS